MVTNLVEGLEKRQSMVLMHFNAGNGQTAESYYRNEIGPDIVLHILLGWQSVASGRSI